MAVTLILNLICIIILLVDIYFMSSRKESREKNLLSACMRISLVYCAAVCMEYIWAKKQEVDLLETTEIISAVTMAVLFIFCFHYVVCLAKVQIKRIWVAGYMSLYTLLIFFIVTNSYYHMFYKNFKVIQNGRGVIELEKEYTAGFYFYCLLLGSTAVFIIYMALHYYRKEKKSINKRWGGKAHLLLVASFIPSLLLFLYWQDINSTYDLVCIGTGISGLFLVYVIRTHNYMEVVQNAKELVAEEMNLGLLIFDRNYQFLEANRFMRGKFPEVEKMLELLETDEKLRDVITGNSDRLEWRDRIYNCQCNEIRNQTGVLMGFALIVYDITELERHAEELGVLKEQAEEANDQKTKFLTNVTHEIRTPLNTILGMSEIALRKNTVKDLENPLKIIYHEGEGVLGMIDTLLDVSKLESGTIEFAHEMYSMEEILYEISNMVYMRIDEKDLDCRVEVENGFPKAFYGDRMRVKEIFQNLLGNAIKYTESGNITLNLSGERDGERYKILLEVKDTGVGMNEEDRKNIFKRFMRSQNPKTENVFGAGLGLNITMNLVKLMGGNITVQSRIGEGTTFLASFYQEIADSEPLGLREMTRERAESHMEDNSFLDQIHVIFPGAHVLIVDDMESNLKVEQGLMQLYGIEPEMALSGERALELLESRKYDLIFLDHMMPQMDGVETLHRMRQMENGRAVPIVAVTANAVAYTTDFYEKSGFDDSLTKPLHTTELLEVLKKYIPSKIQNKEKEESDENLPIKSLMPEIDCVEGIKNIGGSLEKYNELLQVYYNEMAQILEILPELANENLEQFRIKIHGVKGSSRNVGAKQLSTHALQLEEWAKAGKQEEILAQLETFLKELDEVMIRIHSYLKETVQSIERDGDFLPELELTSVYSILKALADFDMDEVEEEVRELYKNRYTDDTEAVLEELKRYVDDLDYKHATELLQGYLEKIG